MALQHSPYRNLDQKGEINYIDFFSVTSECSKDYPTKIMPYNLAVKIFFSNLTIKHCLDLDKAC